MPDTDNRRTLGVDTLGDLDDGEVRRMIDQAIGEAVADCDARATVKDARVVFVAIGLSPKLDTKLSALKGVEIGVEVSVELPPRRSGKAYLRASLRSNRMTALMPDAWPAPLFGSDSSA